MNKFTKNDRICSKMESLQCVNRSDKSMFINCICKPCKKQIQAAYYLVNHDKLIAKAKIKYNLQHPEAKANRVVAADKP